jgi:Tfp pilus assembly protein PilF
MDRKIVARIWLGLMVGMALWVASPAYAQVGTLRGKVVDEAGQGVAGATVTFDFLGEIDLHFTTQTNARGEWTRTGLRASTTDMWRITAKKGDLVGMADIIAVASGSIDVPSIVIRMGGLAAPAAGAAPEMTKEQIEQMKMLQDISTMYKAGNYDAAIAKLNEYTAKDDTCAICYASLGEMYNKKSDAASAEKAYLKAISIDDKSKAAAESYSALANMYNAQRRFDEAAAMSTKAVELQATTGSGGDPSALFNAGVIFWNQGKIAEAMAQFKKAIDLKPDMADPHYYYAMCLVNEGKMPEAKASLEKYLQLAPTGENAAVAKSILDTMK